MTIREVCERVQSAYQAGVATDDSRMSYRLIFSALKSAKATLLYQRGSKRRQLSDRNIEFLECVPMEVAEPHDCPCAPPTGCTILKSTCTIPRPVSSSHGDYIHAVTSIDGTKTFSRTTWVAKSKKKGNKYTSKTQDFFFKDDYLYLTAPTADQKLLKTVTVAGIFADTTDFDCDFCAECDDETKDCPTPLDSEFKIDISLEIPVIDLATKELIRAFNTQYEDRENNAEDDATNPDKKYPRGRFSDPRRPIQ